MKLKKFFAALCVLLCLISLLPQGASAEVPASASKEEWEVLKRTNAERIAQGLDPLTLFPALQNAADIRAKELVTLPDHTRPNGTSWFTVIKESNIPYSSAAENLAAGQKDAARVVTTWMNSSGHRANILTAAYSHLGSGHFFTEQNAYKNHWIQLFVGGCTTTAIRLAGEAPRFDAKGNLLSDDCALAVDCSMHGTAYLPFENADYTLNGTSVTVRYKGVSAVVTAEISNGNPPADNAANFTDVNTAEYYYIPVQWAAENNITTGTEANRFSPDKLCSRAEIVTFLWRAAGEPAPNNSKNPFGDVTQDYYYNAVLWAVENGITNGTDPNRFSPDATCTRAQIVTFLWRAAGEPAPNDPENPFSDVTGDYYYNAVLWAVENGITNGTDPNRFSPDSSCTRAECVTFLYRYFQ